MNNVVKEKLDTCIRHAIFIGEQRHLSHPHLALLLTELRLLRDYEITKRRKKNKSLHKNR